jgi:general L-amino acid transport system permease protein
MPLMLPQDWKFGTLFRAYLALSAFYAAYIAEVIRGGLQIIPRAQAETAMALGLGYWRVQFLVVLPQAYRKVLPALVNTFIDLFKDTTLVSLIGIFDILGVMTNALRDLQWQGLSSEAYLFVALVYFAFCQLMSSYGAWLERQGEGAAAQVPKRF